VALATVPGQVYSRYELINRVRGHEFEGYERTVDSHVRNLRRKIEADPGHAVMVQTALGAMGRHGCAPGRELLHSWPPAGRDVALADARASAVAGAYLTPPRCLARHRPQVPGPRGRAARRC